MSFEAIDVLASEQLYSVSTTADAVEISTNIQDTVFIRDIPGYTSDKIEGDGEYLYGFQFSSPCHRKQ